MALSGPQLLANVLVLKKGKGMGENSSDKREILNNILFSFFFHLLSVVLIRYGFGVR